MSRSVRLLLLFAASVAVFAQATVASAAPSAWKFIDVTVHADQQQSLYLVSGELEPGAKLPYEAELAVPAGLQVQWVGEILGEDPSKDPELKYVKTTAGGMDIYRFTMSSGRVAQVEGTLPSATTFDGASYVTNLKWTAWQAVPEVRISQRLPQSSTIVQAAPGASLAPGDTGYSYYTKTVGPLKAGDVVDLAFSYALPAAGAAPGSASGSSNGLAIGVMLFVVLGGIVLLVMGVQKKSAAKAALREAEEAPSSSQHLTAELDEGAFGDEVLESESIPADSADTPARSRRIHPLLPVIALVGVFVLAFSIAGAKSTSTKVVDGRISRDFGSTSPCQSTSIPFSPVPGVDLAAEGGKILEGFEGMEGVGVVTIDLNQSKVDLAWCESSQTEESMRQVINSSGLITLGVSAQSAPTTASADATGASVQ